MSEEAGEVLFVFPGPPICPGCERGGQSRRPFYIGPDGLCSDCFVAAWRWSRAQKDGDQMRHGDGVKHAICSVERVAVDQWLEAGKPGAWVPPAVTTITEADDE